MSTAMLDQKKSSRLNLSDIPPQLRDQAIQAVNDGNVKRFFSYADSMLAMWIFFDNQRELKRLHLFEAALLAAWGNQKFNVAIFSESRRCRWDNFVRSCLKESDRTKLLKHSDPLPDGDVFTVYRGVGGRKEMRDSRGVSWSLSLDVAGFFSQGYRPTLYRTTVRRSEIFAYINESGRNEQEVILSLSKYHPIERLTISSEMRENFKEAHRRQIRAFLDRLRSKAEPKAETSPGAPTETEEKTIAEKLVKA